MNIEFILNQILDKLKSVDIYRVILFGSYAKAEATPESDIDLVIILNNDDLSKTFSQKAERDAGVRELLVDIYFKYEMDILIYSKAEFNEVKNRGNFFISEVERTGKIIYEKGKRRMIEGLNNQKPNRINIEPILNQILERLKNIKLYKVILFGAYARGTDSSASSIDLALILNNHYLPRTGSDKLERDWNIRKLLLEVGYEYDMNIKIYSIAEFKKIKNKGSAFIDEIEKAGKIIYERSSQRVVSVGR